MTHKEEIARLRKMAHKGVKGIMGGLDKYYEKYDFREIPDKEDIFECTEILRKVLVDIEDIAVTNGKYTIDKIIDYINEGNESLETIEECFDEMYNEETLQDHDNIEGLYVELMDTAYGNIEHFIIMFNKLTKLQKDS